MPNYQALVKYADKVFTDWLYSGWSEDKLIAYEFLNVVPGVHQYMDYKLDVRKDKEYLARYGMTYNDIHDPRKLSQVSSSARALEWVSNNVSRLYR